MPRFLRAENLIENDKRNNDIKTHLKNILDTDEPEEEKLEMRSKLDPSDLNLAIRVIQKTERGRQGIEIINTTKQRK